MTQTAPVATLEARILHVAIAAPFEAAYERAHRPEAFAEWAAGLAETLRETECGWVADTPQGEALVEFTPRNTFGIMDHQVRLEGRPAVYVPLRMVRNGDGVEVELVLFRQPGMSDEAFERDTAAVRADLWALKRLLEADC